MVFIGGPRFENMVAGHLLKFCHYRKPLFAVECKTGEKTISPHLHYFRDRTPIPLFYQVHLGTSEYQDKNIHVLPFETFCRELE